MRSKSAEHLGHDIPPSNELPWKVFGKSTSHFAQAQKSVTHDDRARVGESPKEISLNAIAWAF